MCIGNDYSVFLTIQALTAYLKWMQVYSNAKHCCRWEQCNWLQRAVISLHRRKVHQQLLNISKVWKLAQDVPLFHTTGIRERVYQGTKHTMFAVFIRFFLRIYFWSLLETIWLFLCLYRNIKVQKKVGIGESGKEWIEGNNISESWKRDVLKRNRRKIQMGRREDCGRKWSEKLAEGNLQERR